MKPEFKKIETIEDIFSRPIPLYIYKQHLILDLGLYNHHSMGRVFSPMLFLDNRIDFGIDVSFVPSIIRLR